MDIFGSHIDDCAVTGTDDGYTVQSTNGDEQITGGFIGYANLARMSNCTAGDQDEPESWTETGSVQVEQSRRICRTNKFCLSCRFEVGFWSSECNILTC